MVAEQLTGPELTTGVSQSDDDHELGGGVTRTTDGPDRPAQPEPAEAPHASGGNGETAGPEEHVLGAGPPAQLYLPTDWLNLLEDGDDKVAARRRYERLMGDVFPHMPAAGHREIVEGLMLWRERLWTEGFLAHGVICVPAEGEDKAALWQILVAAMKLPQTNGELDTSALMQRMAGGSELDHLTHVEKYQTEMGLGLGMIGRPPLARPDGGTVAGADGEPRRCGMASALSYAPGAEFGILAVGVSLDPEQDRQLAMMVALIAGKSWLVTDEPEEAPEAGTRAGPRAFAG